MCPSSQANVFLRSPFDLDQLAPTFQLHLGVPGASLCGVHLRLPGVDAKGPTLEIFTYSRLADGAAPAANRPGFAHIAFEVTSVRAARDEIIGAGGQAIGDVVALETATGARVTWCYVTDPEGNIIELQSWSPDPG